MICVLKSKCDEWGWLEFNMCVTPRLKNQHNLRSYILGGAGDKYSGYYWKFQENSMVILIC